MGHRPRSGVRLTGEPRHGPPGFPFAPTYQGSAIEKYDVHVERNNYSAMPLDRTQNGAAGNLLAGFYTNNRMIDGPDDGFIVKFG